MVTNVELTDPRPYIFQSAVYGRLIYTVLYMSDRLLTQANQIPICSPHPICVEKQATGFSMWWMTWRL